jgi:hypothetical protein
VAAANLYPLTTLNVPVSICHAPVATIILEVAMPRRFAFLCVLLLTLNASAVAQQTTPDPSLFVVDGLALYGHVRFESQAYQQYHCSPSEKFTGFIWCHKEKIEKTKRGEVTFSNSILHSPDATAVYINRYIEPAFFSSNEVQTEIDRLSAKFGESARLFRMPRREGLPDAVIAVWGKVQLEQLNAGDVSVVAAGGTVKGLLVSYLGDLQRSAKAGVPVYQLSGGPGFLWAAAYNPEARGVLRFLAIDASQIASPITARNNPPQQQSTQPCTLATPGPGFSVSDGKYVITRDAFDTNTNVESAVKATFGNDATIADWQTLKRLFSTQTQLTDFIERVGIPNQAVNGPCDYFLVSNNGRYRLENGYWLFVARHDGIVPDNWAVLDTIGNHTLDMGRWMHKSQALVFISNKAQPLPSRSSQPSETSDDVREANRRAELQGAKHAAEEAERRRIAADDDARHAVGEAQQQVEAERQKRNIILAASAGVIILLCSVVAFVLTRKGRTVASTPYVAVQAPIMQLPQNDIEKASSKEVPEVDHRAEPEPHPSFEEGDFVEQLAKFAKLHADGVITDEEFKTLKAGLIGLPVSKEMASNEYVKHLKALRDTGAITEAEFQSRVLALLSNP